MRFVRELGLAELELALILAQHDFEEELAGGGFDGVGAPVGALTDGVGLLTGRAAPACCAWVADVLASARRLGCRRP